MRTPRAPEWPLAAHTKTSACRRRARARSSSVRRPLRARRAVSILHNRIAPPSKGGCDAIPLVVSERAGRRRSLGGRAQGRDRGRDRSTSRPAAPQDEQVHGRPEDLPRRHLHRRREGQQRRPEDSGAARIAPGRQATERLARRPHRARRPRHLPLRRQAVQHRRCRQEGLCDRAGAADDRCRHRRGARRSPEDRRTRRRPVRQGSVSRADRRPGHRALRPGSSLSARAWRTTSP